MMKRTSARFAKKRKKQTRNKSLFNPHRYLVAAARKVWRWSPEHREAAQMCAVGTTRRKCLTCAAVLPRKEVHIDHVSPVGSQPRTWDDYPAYYRRLFCPVSNLKGMCVSCHRVKTAKERLNRAKV